MSLIEDIRKDMINASKTGNVAEVEILKMVIASVKNEEISSDKPLTDESVLQILRREKRKIEDSISQFEKMGRQELAEKEKVQLGIVVRYLPTLMTEEQIKEVVAAKIRELGVTDMREMGKVMGVVMKELNGKADGNQVRNIVQQLLS